MTTQAENKVTAQFNAGITGAPDVETTANFRITFDCIFGICLDAGESITGHKLQRVITDNALSTIRAYSLLGDAHRVIDKIEMVDFYASNDGKKKIPIPSHFRASWVDSRGLDAETLVEITSLFDRTLWEKLQKQHDVSCEQLHEFLYDACQAFQEIHAQTDWEEHGDYWGAVEKYVQKINAVAADEPNWIDWDVKELTRIGTSPTCEGCNDTGIRPDATPHAGEPPEGFTVIERCDACDKYPDDLAAAQAWGDEARWQEGNGTMQAIAKPRAKKP
jgi:hypothetical protein